MNIEKQVVSLELARKLKKIGYRQNNVLWYWGQSSYHTDEWCIDSLSQFDQWHMLNTTIAAYTVAELGEMLPKHTHSFWFERDGSKCFACIDRETINNIGKLDKGHTEDGITEADARAKMLIYLLENNLLKK